EDADPAGAIRAAAAAAGDCDGAVARVVRRLGAGGVGALRAAARSRSAVLRGDRSISDGPTDWPVEPRARRRRCLRRLDHGAVAALRAAGRTDRAAAAVSRHLLRAALYDRGGRAGS